MVLGLSRIQTLVEVGGPAQIRTHNHLPFGLVSVIFHCSSLFEGFLCFSVVHRDTLENGESVDLAGVDEVELINKGVLGVKQSVGEAVDVLSKGLGVGYSHSGGVSIQVKWGYLLGYLGVNELTTWAIRAEELLMELGAGSGLVHRCHVFLLLQLVLPMCECTVVAIAALALLRKLATKFGFDFELVIL
jgi:hypothetical protein